MAVGEVAQGFGKHWLERLEMPCMLRRIMCPERLLFTVDQRAFRGALNDVGNVLVHEPHHGRGEIQFNHHHLMPANQGRIDSGIYYGD